jgi:ABC-type Fe3+ transport system substrate-binding protein
MVASLAAMRPDMAARSQKLDQLYAEAKREQTLVLWAAGPLAGYESAVRAFGEQFPGITVSLVGGLSNVLNARLEEQVRASRIEPDIAILRTIQDFIRWNRQGLLLRFEPDGFDKISPLAKDSDGAWIAVNASPIFYGYNTEHVGTDEVPKLAIDFLRQRFKGRLISAYPSADDATLFAFATIVQKYGWGYMKHYMTQQPRFVHDRAAATHSIGSGESYASFDVTVSGARDAQRGGGKLDLAGPADDYLPVFFSAEAIFKDALHPNAAKLFVSWFLSKEWQSRNGLYSSRNDVPSPAGLPPLSKHRLEDRYVDFVSNETNIADLRQRFETYTGQPGVPK